MKNLYYCFAAVAALVFGSVRLLAQNEANPLTIPLKIWTVTDMNGVNSSDPYWTLDISGSFLPSSPNDNGSILKSNHGTKGGFVESVYTDVGTVRVMPFQAYGINIYSVGFLSGKVCVAAPPGYQVWINDGVDDLPRNAVFMDNPEQSLTFNRDISMVVIPTTSGGVQPAGVASRLGTGRLEWHVSLGHSQNGDLAGELEIVNPGTQQDWTNVIGISLHPGSVEVESLFGFDGNNLYHGQYIANEAVADTFVGANGPEIWFYTPAQMSAGGGIRTFTGLPFVKYKLQVTGGTTLTITKEARNIPNATAANVPVARTEVTSVTRSGVWPTFTWSVSDWTESGSSPLVQRIEQSTGTESSRDVGVTIKVPGGATATSIAAGYELKSWGEALTSITAGSGGGAVTATYTYYADPNFICHYGYPDTKTFNNGSWEKYNYLAFAESNPGDRVFAGIPIERFRPWRNSPAAPAANPDTGEYTHWGYVLDPFDFPTRPSVIETRLGGTQVSDVRIAYTPVDELATGLPLVKATRTEKTIGAAALQTTTIFFAENVTDPFFRKKIHSIESPEGTKTVYAYQRGTWAAGVFTPSDTTGLGTGPASRISAIHGTVTAGTSYTSYDGYDIDDVKLVEGKSLLETTVRDDRALIARREVFVWTASGWASLSSVDYGYDFIGRPTGSTTSTGAVYSAGYDGQLLSSEIDSTGVKVSYTYDAADRPSVVTREGTADVPQLTTSYLYDAAGRLTQQTVGSDQDHPLVSTHSFDTAGHLTSEAAPGLSPTSFEYSTVSRQVTITDPNLNTTIETRNLDGTVSAITGSATVAKYFSYGTETDGRQWTQVNLGSDSSPRWEKSWVDKVGRLTRIERPGFTGQPNYVEENTYDDVTPGLLSKTTRTGYAPTLYTYDPLGQLVRTGLDVDRSGALELSSNDRITDTDRFFEHVNDQWWMRSQEVAYPAGSGSSIPLVTTRTRVTGLSGGQTETVVTDEEGNVATTTTNISRAAKTVTVSTASSAFPTATSTIVNGLVAASTGPDGLATTFKYDAFLRLKKSIDSRNNPTETTYYDGTNLVMSVKDGTGHDVRTMSYDTGGRPLWIRDLVSNYTYFAYNTRSQVLRQWGGATYPVEYGYDSNYGELITQRTYRDGTGWNLATWPSNPDPADWTRWVYDPPSGLLKEKYDAANLNASGDPIANAKKVSFTYNARGQTDTRTWARGVSTTYGYDPNTGELTSQTYSDGTPSVSYTYTRWGQLDSVTDVTGVQDFVYDPAKPWRLASEALSAFYGSRVVTALYESSGLIGRAKGFQLGASVGANGDLEQAWSFTGSGRFDTLATKRSGNTISRTFQYGYRSDAALVSGLSVTTGDPFSVSYDYEPKRDLVTKVDSLWSGASRTRYDYVYNDLGQRYTAKQSGDVFADLGNATYYRCVYNSRGELTSAANYLGDTPTPLGGTPDTNAQLPGRNFAYDFDNAGNRRTASRTGTAGAPDHFDTNALNQYTSRENNVAHTAGTVLSSSVEVRASATGGATLSGVGRQGRYWDAQAVLANTSGPASAQLTIMATLAGAGSGGVDRVRTDSSRSAFLPARVQQLEYDEDGNLHSDGIWTYAYDAENRLISATATSAATGAGQPNRLIEFRYDFLDRRVQKVVSLWGGSGWNVSTARRYLYDGWSLVAEFDAPGATSCGSLVRSFTWGLDISGSPTATGGVGALLQITDHSANTSYFPTYDGNGNVAALLRAGDGTAVAKYEYSPAGELLRCEDSASGGYAKQNPFRFSTKFTDDETGLVYYGHRYYSPALGRFINRDPIGEAGGLNLYGFCGNDGVNQIDVLGYEQPAVNGDGSLVESDRRKPRVIDLGPFGRLLEWMTRDVWSTTWTAGESYAGGYSYIGSTRDTTPGVSRTPGPNNPGLATAPNSAMVRASILPDGWTYRPGLPKGDATYTLADYQALAAELGWRGFTDMQPDEQLYFGRTAVDLLRYEAATGRDMGAAWDGLYRTPQLAQSADFRMGGAMAAETIGVATVVVSGAGALGVISPKGANVRMVNPENIRFSQDSIKAEFKDPRFGTIDDLAAGLRGKTIKPGDIEPIRVVVRNGELVSIDNRRLEAFRRAGVEVPVRMATPSEIREAIRQGKFSAGELGSPTIRVRGGGG